MSNIEIKTKKITSHNFMAWLVELQNSILEGWFIDPSQAGIVNLPAHHSIIVKRGESIALPQEEVAPISDADEKREQGIVTEGIELMEQPDAELSIDIQESNDGVAATPVAKASVKVARPKTTRAKATQE